VGCIRITFTKPLNIKRQLVYVQNSIEFKEIIRLL
jgi:hypothetical protein